VALDVGELKVVHRVGAPSGLRDDVVDVSSARDEFAAQLADAGVPGDHG
jgi:hypothetical protein